MTSDMLQGVTVLDFTSAAVGPFCSRILADMGAEVIRVEWPRGLEAAAFAGGRFTPEGLRSGASLLFLHCNGGKKSLCIDLKQPAGLELVRKLAVHADVVVENFTPHALRNLGLDYEHLRQINPSIIMCSLTGYGQEGLEGNPDHPCTDPIAQAMSGLNWITGERNGPPFAIGGGIGDTVTSLTGAIAIGFALYHRQRTGVGQYIDLAMIQSLLFVDCTVMPYVAANDGQNIFFRNGQQNTYTFPMGPLKAREGYLSLQAPGRGLESPWGRLCQAMGRPELAADERYLTDRDRIARTDEVVAILEGWLQSLPSDEAALAILARARISSGPVLSQEQILNHPAFARRRAFQTVEYPGLGTVKVVAPAFKMSEANVSVRGPAPEYGEHNADVLTRLLNLGEQEVQELTEQGVLYESEAARKRQQVGLGAAD
jgi:crotonobetainyl-CoA:carnitine CoA-transferase CaiB-like acyl-CoA transferase